MYFPYIVKLDTLPDWSNIYKVLLSHQNPDLRSKPIDLKEISQFLGQFCYFKKSSGNSKIDISTQLNL